MLSAEAIIWKVSPSFTNFLILVSLMRTPYSNLMKSIESHETPHANSIRFGGFHDSLTGFF